jgi:type IX secretion system substrate protein
MNFKLVFAILLLCSFYSLSSQEYVTGIVVNEAIEYELKKISLDEEYGGRNIDEVEPVLLPFFDDFSTTTVFPDQNLWDGNSVFVNKDFPFMPVNLGAATLDAIDETGRLYNYASSMPFKADELMSQPIRMDSIFYPISRKLSPADSVYFSFYYQPQGVAYYPPQDHDSLVLEYSHHTGEVVFSHMDSVLVNADIYMTSPTDTIWPLDTLWAPTECNPDVFTINYNIVVWGDIVEVACDSVFIPEVVWDQIWYSEGLSLEDFVEAYGRNMVQINIPVIDTIYFSDNFRFRFRNYASVSNDNYPDSWKYNGDQWNIDYVYLNYNRSLGDTTYRALTFSQRAPSFLEHYEVMPFKQYSRTAIANTKKEFQMFITNLDDIERNTKYSYHVKQVNGIFKYDYNGGSCNLKPFYEFGFQECVGCGTAHACPPVQSVFSSSNTLDTASFIITHYISDSSDQNSIVDSAIYRQGFYNYFAYDDGTPEGGYGIDAASGFVACQFDLSEPDTLFGVQMFFNRTLNDANEVYFDLLIWGDNDGKPGQILHRLERQKVSWGDGLYSFYPYVLDEPIKLSGTFYVGWEQFERNNLNIGFDANNNRKKRVFYKQEDGWKNATKSGAVMMRPYLESDMILSANNNLSENNKLIIFPNPASSHFYIRNSEIVNDHNAEIRVFNMFGKEVYYQYGIGSQINTEYLSSGIYIIRVVSRNIHYSSKLLINR